MSGLRGGRLLSSFSDRRWRWSAWLVISIAYVALYLHLPVGLLASARLDDAWFFGRAHDLAAGRWLGPYSAVTLMKGPGYPFFLAACYGLGVSAMLAQALLNLAASSLFARALWRIGACWPLAAGIFVACLWHPYLFPLRVIRDDIYAAQALLYLACLIETLVARGKVARIVWPVGAGLSFAWLWMTREEGVWVAPASVMLCTAILWRDRSRLIDLARAAAAAAAVFAVVMGANFAVYRTMSIVDFKGRAYRGALDALQSVRVGEPVAYVPVPGKVRDRLYTVSPAFASLRPYFEGEGRNWMAEGCRIYPGSCGDYAGGWFVWALRDAVSSVGAYDTAAHADAFYRTLAAEIHAACRDGRLTCSRGLVSYLPAITPAQWRAAPARAGELASLLMVRQPPPLPDVSAGNPVELRVFWDFVGLPRRTLTEAERTEALEGAYAGPQDLALQARCSGPGGDKVFPAAVTQSGLDQAFAISIPAEAACRLQVAGAGPADPALSYDSAASGQKAVLAGRVLRLGPYAKASDLKGEAAAQRTLGWIAAVFKRVATGLLVLAVLAWAAHWVMMARGRGRLDVYWWTTHALWLLLATRAGVLLLVDISSFPGVTIPYLSAAFPLAFAAALMTIGLAVRALWPDEDGQAALK